MSKAISFGFGKSKGASQGPKAAVPKPAPRATSKAALKHDSDNEEDAEPQHESVTGFSSSGAILSQPLQETRERVIINPGNEDWRRRGRTNLLPEEVQAQQNGDVVIVEKNEVSTASGLRLAPKEVSNGIHENGNTTGSALDAPEPAKPFNADEEALQALLGDESKQQVSNAVIAALSNSRLTQRDEAEDFRTDVASRPDPSTLDDYAAMPVEEFGLAMLRGMGQKRRANGEVIDLSLKEENPRKTRKQEGFLGIGAKSAPGTDIELGAWGKADMRKNNKGQGFFTPLMRVNERTGERLTEEELQRRVREQRDNAGGEDWRDRRDRQTDRTSRQGNSDGRDGHSNDSPDGDSGYRDQMNSFTQQSSSSRTGRHRNDADYDSSRSRRNRSRSRSRDRRRRDDDQHGYHNSKGRHKDSYRDDDRYDSSSFRRGEHNDRRRHTDEDDDRRHRHR